ncbi:ATP-binding cassette domain-containing protein [Mesomycoplasma neurolyticum]|uniref:ABC transporter ATP-binding protein n=1 Tax=Mesomycoplasma neurolyticum TaxID=2120 RepID=A0A449A5M9_9BACT|nr:ABC transporter ATP-binding protein [Mesomycoplasma neurolyticum]VEU59532.1 ABC transporter ATP-binding protein [Mesomycoplasma neurolyticum]
MNEKIKKLFLNKTLLFLLLFLSVIKNIFFGASFFSLYQVFERITNNNTWKIIFFYAGISLLFLLLNFLVNFFYKKFYQKLLSKLVLNLNEKAIETIIKNSPCKIFEKSENEILYYSYDLPIQISNYFYEPIFLLIEDIIKAIILVTLFFYFNWLLGLICLVLAILLIVYFNISLLKMTEYDYKIIDIEENNRYKIEYFIKLHSDFFYLDKKNKWFDLLFFQFRKNHNSFLKYSKKFAKWDFLNQIISGIVSTVLLLIISFFAYYHVFDFNISLFMIFLVMIGIWLRLIIDIYRTIPAFKLAKEIQQEIDSFFRLQTNKNIIYNNEKIETLLIEDLNFLNFKNLNLKIKQGDKLLINGSSGIGKSVLMKLITNNINLEYKGNILWNNINVKKISNKQMVENITFIDSENLVLNDSIINNITFYNSNPDLEKLSEVLNLLNLKIDLNSKANNLSEGQKQRLNFAKILMENNDKILILDEAYNNIDEATANQIRKILMSKSRIYIEISHHLNNKNQQFNKYIDLNKWKK